MRRSKRSNTPAPLHEAVKGAADGIARASAGDQAELFGLPCEDPRGEIEKARARGVREGRPKGAESIATRELRRWLLSRGVLPQQSLMQWFQLGPEGLAQALGCPKLEAFDRWARLGEKLGRYFMPMKPAKGEGGRRRRSLWRSVAAAAWSTRPANCVHHGNTWMSKMNLFAATSSSHRNQKMSRDSEMQSHQELIPSRSGARLRRP